VRSPFFSRNNAHSFKAVLFICVGGPTDVPPTEIGSHAGMATMNLGSSVIYAANEPSLALYRVQVKEMHVVPIIFLLHLFS